MTGRGVDQGALCEREIEQIVARGLQDMPFDGQRVLVLIPDGTRSFPMPLFFRLVTRYLMPRVTAIDFLVALGTHAPMSEEALLRLVGITAQEKATTYARVRVLNHAWDNPAALTQLGTISADEISLLTGGLMKESVPVRLNRLVLEYDQMLVCAPVFPHEVVGFSGGDKYFFPGIAGADIINLTHWVGALITSYEIIGTKSTPVRAIIERAAGFIPKPRWKLAAVITHEGVAGVFAGTTTEAWAAAADLSSRRHIVWVDRPYRQVLSVLPKMYDDIWTGAKGMYKTEPCIADGGEVIIYAPHITEFSSVHGTAITEIGYHVRDYFAKQWDKFKHIPWGVLAHSTHLRGAGTYVDGVEKPRIGVTLATGISAADCRAANLGYRDPATIDPAAFAGREAEGVLLVPKAGENLYRLKRA